MAGAQLAKKNIANTSLGKREKMKLLSSIYNYRGSMEKIPESPGNLGRIRNTEQFKLLE